MKKFLFLGVSVLFGGLLFWKISFFDFSLFHFYGLIDEIFIVINAPFSNYLAKYIPLVLLLGVYVISLVYIALFYKKKFVLIFPLILMEIFLYYLVPQLTFIFIGTAFAVGSLMLIVQVVGQNRATVKLSFFDLVYKGISKFVRYALIILCLYNFILIKNQPFVVPESALNVTIQYIENMMFNSNLLNGVEAQENTTDLQQSICTQLQLDEKTCLPKLNQLMQTEDLGKLAQDLGHTSPTELNFNEIINLKIQMLLEPYQQYLPYLLTMMFFSCLYFVLSFLIFIYAFFAVIIHLLLLKTKLVTVDVREVPQEVLI